MRDRDPGYVEYVTARQTQLRRMAYAICGNWNQADDLLQTAFVKLYVAWPKLHKVGAEDAYVRRILVRAHIDESRRPWRREVAGLDDRDDAAQPAADPDPDQHADLVAALQQLPPMQRKVVVLRHLFDLSIEETGHTLGISAGTVKSHSARGRDRLQSLLSTPSLAKDL